MDETRLGNAECQKAYNNRIELVLKIYLQKITGTLNYNRELREKHCVFIIDFGESFVKMALFLSLFGA